MPVVDTNKTYALGAGQAINAVGQTAVQIFDPGGPSPSAQIDGAISVSATVADITQYFEGVLFLGGFFDGATLRIGATGSIQVTTDGNARGVYGSSTPDIVNAGQIRVTGRQESLGVTSFDTVRVENTGVIQVSGGLYARGVWLGNGSNFSNAGTIEVSANNPRPSGPNTIPYATTAVMLDRFNADVTNSGTIRAVTIGANSAIGVSLSSGGRGQVFSNSGVIEGDQSLVIVGAGQTSRLDQVLNTGSLIGQVSLTYGKFSVTNSGRIVGDVILGYGDDTYDGRGGVISGALQAGDGADSVAGGGGDETFFGLAGDDTLDGGAGADSLYGGIGNDRLVGGAGVGYLRGEDGDDELFGSDAFDNTHGNVGNDTVHGGGFDDWVVGGQGDDVLFGDDGGDLCYGQLGTDTVDGGAGDDAVIGGQANDVLNGGAGNDFVTGDRGDDTVTGGLGADTFHTNNVQGLDRVTDFSQAQGDKVLVDAGSAYTLSQVGADTVIDMGGGNQMILVGVQLSSLTTGWISGG